MAKGSQSRWHCLEAWAVFMVVALAGAGARVAIGTVQPGSEVLQLIQRLTDAGLFIGSAIATASATTLALMLTLIGMMRRVEHEFDVDAYQDVARIARTASLAMFVSLILLLLLAFPVGEFERFPPGWYPILYEILFVTTVGSVGLMAATVALLYQTVRRVIATITPGDEV